LQALPGVFEYCGLLSGRAARPSGPAFARLVESAQDGLGASWGMSTTAPLRGAAETVPIVPGTVSPEGWASILLRDPVEEEIVVPMLRGVSHVVAFWLALVASFVLVSVAPGPRRGSALVYGFGLCALFAISGLYHRWR
jgi:hypothetical protein